MKIDEKINDIIYQVEQEETKPVNKKKKQRLMDSTADHLRDIIMKKIDGKLGEC